ncbi:MAG: hypothetical protein GH143_07265 [Calditrichaeota bacterium]|nr:hypothetical protein [Calditrichota bacterium]
MEARKARVLQALRILSGDGAPETDPEEACLLREFREIRESGFGRLEVIVVDHRIEGINPTRTLKRKNLGLPPKTA